MELRRQIAALRRAIPVVIVCALAAAVIAYLLSGLLPRSYQARTSLIVGQSLSAVNPDYSQLLASQSLSTTYAQLATTQTLLGKVVRDVGLAGTADDLRRRVNTTTALNSSLLSIDVTDVDAARAAATANAIADELVKSSPELQGQEAAIRTFVADQLSATEAQIVQTQDDIATLSGQASPAPDRDARLQVLQAQLTSLRASYASLLAFISNDASNLLTIVDRAAPPVDAVWPRPLLNAAFAAILAALAVIAIALAIHYLDDTIKTGDDVETELGLSMLGGIPKIGGQRGRKAIYGLAVVLYPRSAAAEAFRSLRANLEFTSVDTPLRTLLVTSAGPGEGKTVTASNLAVAFAQAGRRVLLIDADFRKPGIDSIFNVSNADGLSNLLRTREASWEPAVHTTEVPNLSLLTTGPQPPNPAELLGTMRMKAMLESMHESFDLVILDSPPVLLVTDGAILSSLADGALLIVDRKLTSRAAARRGRDALLKTGTRILGVALNSLPSQEFPIYSSYYASSAPADLGDPLVAATGELGVAESSSTGGTAGRTPRVR